MRSLRTGLRHTSAVRKFVQVLDFVTRVALERICSTLRQPINPWAARAYGTAFVLRSLPSAIILPPLGTFSVFESPFCPGNLVLDGRAEEITMIEPDILVSPYSTP